VPKSAHGCFLPELGGPIPARRFFFARQCDCRERRAVHDTASGKIPMAGRRNRPPVTIPQHCVLVGLQRVYGRVLLIVMRQLAGERAQWLARNVVPHEGAIRAWLRTRAVGLDVDDIIQEMYARIASLASTDDIRDPRQYATQAAFSILANQLRRARIVPIAAVANLDELGISAPDVSADAALEFRDELRALETTLAELPERCRRAFLLRRVEGLSQRDVAARLSISEKTVEKYMAQAVRLLIAVYGRGGKAAAKVSSSEKQRRIGRP